MPNLTVIVPSRGRPHTLPQLAAAFRATCTSDTRLLFAVDEDDPEYPAYRDALGEADAAGFPVRLVTQPCGTMISALNRAARVLLGEAPEPDAIGFMGDDHRPRTHGWDAAYLDALAALPGIVYGDDLIQGAALCSQFAVTTDIVRRLGHMAPPVLTHMYMDNYWLILGQEAGCITYLPEVVVQHFHPAGGTAEWDDGYRRVNAPLLYARDRSALEVYLGIHITHEVAELTAAGAGVPS
ncbi:glycosyltransferase family 2 protein [Streptomyces sp. NPDC004561]